MLVAEFQCQQSGGVVCLTKIHCISGPCLDDSSIEVSSASVISIMLFLFVMDIFILFSFELIDLKDGLFREQQ